MDTYTHVLCLMPTLVTWWSTTHLPRRNENQLQLLTHLELVGRCLGKGKHYFYILWTSLQGIRGWKP